MSQDAIASSLAMKSLEAVIDEKTISSTPFRKAWKSRS